MIITALSETLQYRPASDLPRVIFFDAMGTLFGLKSSVGDVYAAIAAQHGVTAEPKSLTQAFFETFKNAPPLAFGENEPEKLNRLEFQWWYSLAAQSFIKVGLLAQFGNFEAFFRELYQHFATATPWVLYPDVLPTLTHWRAQNVTLGIISNFDSRLNSVIEALGLGKYFASVSCSSRSPVAKPHRQIFQQALTLHGVSSLEAWHIGDSPQEDYFGAQTAGLHAFLIQRAA